MEAVMGASGYIGGRLVERLAGEGRPVRALARDPTRLAAGHGVEPIAVDLLAPRGLEPALDGCRVAYYLVHSMEAGAGPFYDRDRRAAEAFVAGARAAGVDQLVYLGGLLPAPGEPPSRHLASRLEVEQILLGGIAGSTALRASIVVGARSPSFRMLVRLIERLRLLPVGGWAERRTRPIDERDAIELLALTPGVAAAGGRSLDVAGPDELSYGELLGRTAESMGVARPAVALGKQAERPVASVVSALTGQPLELVGPLLESLEHDLLPRDDQAAAIYGLRPRSLRRAIEHALGDWEAREALAAR